MYAPGLFASIGRMEDILARLTVQILEGSFANLGTYIKYEQTKGRERAEKFRAFCMKRAERIQEMANAA